MPLIMPIKDLRNTSEISDIAHRKQEPIFITKNGYSDLVVMSSELYDKFTSVNYFFVFLSSVSATSTSGIASSGS